MFTSNPAASKETWNINADRMLWTSFSQGLHRIYFELIQIIIDEYYYIKTINLVNTNKFIILY